jgi:hypothetical protein
VITEPRAAAFDALLSVLSWLYAAAAPLPLWFTVNKPGPDEATSRLPPAISSPVSATRIAIRCGPRGEFEGT